MRRIYLNFLNIVVLFLALSGCVLAQENNLTYMGQKPPGSIPQLFMPGLVSTNGLDVSIASLAEGNVCVYYSFEKGVNYIYRKDGAWSKPAPAPWQVAGTKNQFTADPAGDKLYFFSRNATSEEDTRADCNTWAAEWNGTGWNEAYPLDAPINTEKYSEVYPSKSSKNDFYFFSWGRGGIGLGDIYVSTYVEGKNQNAVCLKYPVNTEYDEIDSFVAPDGSYLMFGSGRPGGYSHFDIFICFLNDNGGWSHPVNIGKHINTPVDAGVICVTPDNKYMFFSSGRPTDVYKGESVNSRIKERIGDIDIYWTDAGFIERLKERTLNTKCAAELIQAEYDKNGIESAKKLLSDVFENRNNEYHFEVSELLNISTGMLRSGKITDADIFYSHLADIFEDNYRIEQGYAIINLYTGYADKGISLLNEFWEKYPSAKLITSLDPVISTLYETGETETALKLNKFLVKQFPGSHVASIGLASAYQQKNDFIKAIEQCEKSLKLKPDFIDAQELLEELKSKIL